MRYVIEGFKREFGSWWLLGIVGMGVWLAIFCMGVLALMMTGWLK